MTCRTSLSLPEELSFFLKMSFFQVLRFDIVTIGNGLQTPGNGGCKVGNVYIATTLLSSKPYQVFPDTGVADGFAISLLLGSDQNDLLISVNQLS